MSDIVKDLFPYPEFRENQYKIIKQCIEYFNDGTEVIIIDAPVGFGKSPVNYTLGRYFAPSYYTTPQKSLREQLGKEFGDSKLIIDGGNTEVVVLKARKDYTCRSDNYFNKKFNSDDCPNRKSANSLKKCSNNPQCVYWKQKEGLFKSAMGILTFANLIVNTYIPVFDENRETVDDYGEIIYKKGKQLSFENRNLLIVDECHSLEGQVASLHAGFRITPYSFPERIRRDIWDDVKRYIPKNPNEIKEFLDIVLSHTKANKYSVSVNKGDKQKEVEKIDNLKHKMEYLKEELEEGRNWVINPIEISYRRRSMPEKITVPYFKPIYVDRFLQKHVWHYADKIILSSATIPFRNNIAKWLSRIGLKDKSFKLIQVPMTFPIENRPIHYRLGGSLSGKGMALNWANCVRNVKEILKENKGKQGVIHVSSYKIMKSLTEELKSEFSIYPHDKEKLESEDIIIAWIKSKKEVLISPAVFEGVDLKYDLCRFQILFKVPYAYLGDSRVKHLLFKEKDQEWYNNEVMMKITQAYGRAIRAKDDSADFYIIDSAFSALYQKIQFPKWFKEAIKRKPMKKIILR